MISTCLVPHLSPHGAFPPKRYYPKSNGWMLGKKGKKRERESERRGEGERNAISPPTTASHRRKQFTDESNFISFALHKKRGNADIFLQTDAQRHSWDRNSFSCWQMRVGGLPKSDNKGECSVLQRDPERMVFRRESKFIKYSPAVPDKYWLFWGGSVCGVFERSTVSPENCPQSTESSCIEECRTAGLHPCHLYADRDMAACDEVTFTNDPYGQLFEYLVLAWAIVTLKLIPIY